MSLDGSFLLSSVSIDEKEQFKLFKFDPTMGFFIANRLELGLGIDYTKYDYSTANEELGSIDSEQTALSLGATLYFTPKLYLSLFLSEPDVDVDEDHMATIGTGLLVPLSRQVFLDYGLGYMVGVGKDVENFSSILIGGGVKVIF